MSRSTVLAAASVCVSMLTAAVLVSHAGPLNPPAGGVAGTYKTLAEVEPRTIINSVNTPGDSDSLYKITQPGSYYLTQNLIAVAGKHGIEVAADGVTIDLRGYALLGSAAALDGINTTVAVKALSVIHGTASGWDNGSGIFAGNCTGGRFEDLTLNNNRREGLWPGASATVTRCVMSANSRNGMVAGDGCSIWGCVAVSNSQSGFEVGSTTTIRDCTARLNTLNGILLLDGCLALNNDVTVIAASTVGIGANGSAARIEGNHVTTLVSSSATGIRSNGATSKNMVARNTVTGAFQSKYFLSAGSLYGPIITGATGDLSLVTGANHPLANFAN